MACLIITLVGLLLLLPVVSQETTTPPVAAPTVASMSPDTIPPSLATTGEQWSGCVDPNTGFQLVTIGQPTTVCLVLSSSPDWATNLTYMRLNFQPIADQYSRFHVPQSYTQLFVMEDSALSNSFPGNITVHAESQSA
jgi:hypothetical protein